MMMKIGRGGVGGMGCVCGDIVGGVMCGDEVGAVV